MAEQEGENRRVALYVLLAAVIAIIGFAVINPWFENFPKTANTLVRLVFGIFIFVLLMLPAWLVVRALPADKARSLTWAFIVYLMFATLLAVGFTDAVLKQAMLLY